MISKQIIRAFISGTLAYLVHLSILIILIEIFYLHPLKSNMIGFCLGVVVNFLLYVTWVIPIKKMYLNNFLFFFIINIIGLVLHSLIFYSLYILKINYIFSQSISSMLIFLLNYHISKKYIFAKNAFKN
jgi:putative flippase GtrA